MVLTYSCDKQDEVISNEIESIENLRDDPSFIQMMNAISSPSKSNNLNLDLALELTSRDDLTDLKLVILSNALGFIDLEEMKTFLTNQIKLSIDIEERYTISNYDIEYIQNILLSDDFSKSSPCTDRCFGRSENCIIAATATAVVAHLGCATLDFTVIGGIICHSAVATIQYVENSNCQYDLDDCTNNQ